MTGSRGLKLSVYVGERERAGAAGAASAVVSLLTRERVRACVLLRGAEGFGIKHRLRTERLLTLSEDLPLVVFGVDRRERIEPLLEEVRALVPHGLITLERVALPTDAGMLRASPAAPAQMSKLTIFCGRQQRLGSLPAHERLVAACRAAGGSGACALLGVDGSLAGDRRRAHLLAGNARVPMIVVAHLPGEGVPAMLAELEGEPDALALLETVSLCKRDGRLLAAPPSGPAPEDGLSHWQKLVVQSGERAEHESRPIHSALVRRLREAGAAGATSLRARWGFSGEHDPHGERFWSIARHAPVLTEVMDTPENIARWFEIVDQMTGEAGLVTSEFVPALRAAGPGIEHGGLRLAPRRRH